MRSDGIYTMQISVEEDLMEAWNKRVIETLTAVVLVAGFALTVSQLWRLQEGADMGAWDAVSKQWLELDKMMIANPDVRKYLYEKNPLPADASDRDKVLAAGRYILDLIDNAVSTSNYI
jgi:hypothetical protein